MDEVLEVFKKANTFYIATIDGDKPRVRPFGGMVEAFGRLYFATTNKKEVYKQLLANPNVELCALAGGTWARISAVAVHDERREARAAMLDSTPKGRSTYNEDDGLFEVFYLKDATATINSFGNEPKEIKF